MSDFVQSTSDLRLRGVSSAELRAGIRAGQRVRVRRGAYAEATADAVMAHRQLIEATVPLLDDDAVLSHVSASVLHGLPTWEDQLGRVVVDRSRDQGGRQSTWVHIRPVVLPVGDVTVIHGRRATTLARTVVDCARTFPYERGVAVADAALHRGLDPAELLAVIQSKPRRVGNPRARAVLSFADARAESVGESISRVAMVDGDVPTPTLQFEVVDQDGRFVARTDFAWEEFRTVGEFDGKVKYGRLLRPGETASDAVFREKRREDAVRELGYKMFRWCLEDLSNPRAFGRRLWRVLES